MDAIGTGAKAAARTPNPGVCTKAREQWGESAHALAIAVATPSLISRWPASSGACLGLLSVGITWEVLLEAGAAAVFDNAADV